MTYHIAKPYRPGWAIPQYIQDEGLKRHAFTTMWAPQGTYDNPSVDDAAFNSGYVVPQYILNDGYGRGASVTKWAKRGSYFGPKIPSFLDKPANKVVAVQPGPNGSTAVTVQALSGLGDDTAALPDDFHQYGQNAASIILKGVRTQPPGKRKAMLKSVLDRVDPTLYNRTSKIAKGLTKRGVAPAAALHAGLAQAMGTGMLNEVTKTGQTGQVPPPRGQLGLGCYGICGSGSALGGSVDLRAGKRTCSTGLRGLLGLGITTVASQETNVVASTAQASATPVLPPASATSVAGQRVVLSPTILQSAGTQVTTQPTDPGQAYMMNIGPTNPDGSPAGPVWLLPAVQMSKGAIGRWIMNADGSNWSGFNADGSLVGGVITYDDGGSSGSPNYIKDNDGNVVAIQTIPTGTRIANATGSVREPYFTQRFVGTGYTPNQFETMTQAATLVAGGASVPVDGVFIVTTMMPNWHTAMIDDTVIQQAPILDGLMQDFQWQIPPPTPDDSIDNALSSNSAPVLTYTDPSQITPGAAAIINKAITSANGGSGDGYGNFWGMTGWEPARLAQYQAWVTALGIGPDQNYYMPMLDGVSGDRQRPIAKFTHPMCVDYINSMSAYMTSNPQSTQSCAGWGIYLFLNTKQPGVPWSSTNPYVLRLYINVEPTSFWDGIWNGIETLIADIVKDAEAVLKDLGAAACALVSNANTTKLSTTTAAGVNVAKIVCGSGAPPPVQTGIDTATLLLIAGGALAMILAIRAAKKHKQKAAGT